MNKNYKSLVDHLDEAGHLVGKLAEDLGNRETWEAEHLHELAYLLRELRKEMLEMRCELKRDIRYVSGIPRKPLPEGRVLVHNHIVPQRELGLNGFRAWTEPLNGALEVCSCKWAGVDLRGLTHYRVRRTSAP